MQLGAVVAARQACPFRPGWCALFVKAFAAVAARRPELRRAFVARPWHHLYQYDHNVVGVVVERDVDGEPAVFTARILSPERMSLAEIDAKLRHYKQAPVAEISGFRDALRMASLPLPLRRLIWSLLMNWMPRLRGGMVGTMGVTATANAGLTPILIPSPWPVAFSYGPLDERGSLVVRVTFDHRIFDGMLLARALQEVEQELCGPIVAELRANVSRAA
jgi:hypothetical protein